MKIVTAANFRMRGLALSCVKSAQKVRYPIVVYNLGGLGFGKPFTVSNQTFQEKGFYHEIHPGRCNRGSHKMKLIKDILSTYNEFIVYLDADTFLLRRIDEVLGDYDIGITVRPEWEVNKVIKNTRPSNDFIYDGYVNIGVMFFNATEATHRFLEEWEYKTKELQDDQGAINDMFKEYFPLRSDQTIKRKGVKIRTFDTLQYNYYYFNWAKIYKSYSVTGDDMKIKWQDAKILHFKGMARSEYSRICHPFKSYFTKVMNPFLIK